MKCTDFISRIVALLALTLLSASSALAYTSVPEISETHSEDTFVSTQHHSALFVEEHIQLRLTEDIAPGLALVGLQGGDNFALKTIEYSSNCPLYLLDFRQQLYKSIFPFHFFW